MRLLCPWDFPGKSTGVGCHCLLLKFVCSQTNVCEAFLVSVDMHMCRVAKNVSCLIGMFLVVVK